uniref:Uncharacterized protein n=1 Tax=Rhizophora mucronata TaxID=61149 RepID=A0A2P2Q8W3_RHIMU
MYTFTSLSWSELPGSMPIPSVGEVRSTCSNLLKLNSCNTERWTSPIPIRIKSFLCKI